MNHGGNVWQGNPGAWLDFSANIRADGTPEWVREALMTAMGHTAYYPDASMRAARIALAKYLCLPAECVLPTAGGIAAIELASGLPAPGALIFDPAFSEYEHASRIRGLTIRRAPLPETLGEGTDEMVWLNNPNNPTGRAFSRDEVLAFHERIRAAGGRLIVDEAFIGYCPECSVAGAVQHYPTLTVVGSLTKTLGIPGVRLGYLAAHPDVICALEPNLLPWSLNCFAAAVAEALPGHERELVADVILNIKRRAAMARELKALGIEVFPSLTNYLLARFPSPVSPIARRLRDEKILVRECMNFRGLDDGFHLRLAVKKDDENARLIREIKRFL